MHKCILKKMQPYGCNIKFSCCIKNTKHSHCLQCRKYSACYLFLIVCFFNTGYNTTMKTALIIYLQKHSACKTQSKHMPKNHWPLDRVLAWAPNSFVILVKPVMNGFVVLKSISSRCDFLFWLPLLLSGCQLLQDLFSSQPHFPLSLPTSHLWLFSIQRLCCNLALKLPYNIFSDVLLQKSWACTFLNFF